MPEVLRFVRHYLGTTYVEGGDHEPEKEDGLEEEVEGEPVQQEVGEGLDDGDESVDGPVGQPNIKFNKGSAIDISIHGYDPS